MKRLAGLTLVSVGVILIGIVSGRWFLGGTHRVSNGKEMALLFSVQLCGGERYELAIDLDLGREPCEEALMAVMGSYSEYLETERICLMFSPCPDVRVVKARGSGVGDPTSLSLEAKTSGGFFGVRRHSEGGFELLKQNENWEWEPVERSAELTDLYRVVARSFLDGAKETIELDRRLFEDLVSDRFRNSAKDGAKASLPEPWVAPEGVVVPEWVRRCSAPP